MALFTYIKAEGYDGNMLHLNGYFQLSISTTEGNNNQVEAL
jgi:hypothetical protein